VREAMGEKGASDRAARAVLEHLEGALPTLGESSP